MTDGPPGVEAWKDQASAFDRVRSIAGTLSEPKPASYIADEAHVAGNTARAHLERLVEMNVLVKTDDDGLALYSPDPLHTRLQTLRGLLESHDRDDLIERKAELQDQIETWREEYNATGPDDLRDRAAETNNAEETRNIVKTASDWELVLYRLSVIEDAIKNYRTYNQDYPASA